MWLPRRLSTLPVTSMAQLTLASGKVLDEQRWDANNVGPDGKIGPIETRFCFLLRSDSEPRGRRVERHEGTRFRPNLI